MFRAVGLSLLWAAADAQFYKFCVDGVSTLDVADDKGVPSVDLIVMQSPLFSSNPKFGTKLRYLGLFHTAVAFAQNGKYWSLEFDFTSGSILDGVMPKVDGQNLVWNNDARYCLSPGLVWGREHWSQVFQPVARLTSAQAQSVIEDFVKPLNSSAHGHFPQYQLWRTGKRDKLGHVTNPFIRDCTCSDGVSWLLHHVTAKVGVPVSNAFRLMATVITVNTEAVSEVDPTDAKEWSRMVAFYERLNKFGHNSTITEKVELLFEMMWHEYVYDTNAGKYYRLWSDAGFPIRFSYVPVDIAGPPAEFLPQREQEQQEQSLVVQV